MPGRIRAVAVPHAPKPAKISWGGPPRPPSGHSYISSTGFPACAPHRQDAGATKNFSRQLLMGLRPTRKS
jgi:hypothetical protein